MEWVSYFWISVVVCTIVFFLSSSNEDDELEELDEELEQLELRLGRRKGGDREPTETKDQDA